MVKPRSVDPSGADPLPDDRPLGHPDRIWNRYRICIPTGWGYAYCERPVPSFEDLALELKGTWARAEAFGWRGTGKFGEQPLADYLYEYFSARCPGRFPAGGTKFRTIKEGLMRAGREAWPGETLDQTLDRIMPGFLLPKPPRAKLKRSWAQEAARSKRVGYHRRRTWLREHFPNGTPDDDSEFLSQIVEQSKRPRA